MARATSSCWPYAVSITIGIGRSSRIVRAASIPSRRGILTSRTARSGSVARASSTASNPSFASAHTSKPARSSNCFRSSRMIVSSSAIRIRTASKSPIPLRKRERALRRPPVEDVDGHAARLYRGIRLGEPPSVVEVDRVKAEATHRLVGLLAERSGDGHDAPFAHRADMRQMSGLKTFELVARVLVCPLATTEKHEAVALELHQAGKTTWAR